MDNLYSFLAWLLFTKRRVQQLCLTFSSHFTPFKYLFIEIQAAAAMKVHIATRYGDHSHVIFRIDVNECFHQAMREKVPFHEVRLTCACMCSCLCAFTFVHVRMHVCVCVSARVHAVWHSWMSLSICAWPLLNFFRACCLLYKYIYSFFAARALLILCVRVCVFVVCSV